MTRIKDKLIHSKIECRKCGLKGEISYIKRLGIRQCFVQIVNDKL